MRSAANIVTRLVQVLGIVQILLGVLFWTGNALGLVGIHIINGLVIVLGLWVLCGLALAARANPGLAAIAFLWGIVVVALGLTQTELLQGGLHWVIQVLHLLVGLVALGMAERLGRAVRDTAPVRAA